MTFPEIVFLAFWPFVFALAATYWRFRSTENFKNLYWTLVSLFLLLPCFFLLMFAGSNSLIAINFFNVSLLIVGIALVPMSVAIFARAILGLGAALSNPQGASRTKIGFLSVVTLLVGGAAIYFGGVRLYKDHALPKLAIEGPIDALEVFRHTKGQPEYYTVVRGREIYVTKPLWETLTVGETIRAEVGQGTRYAYRIQRKLN
jgi:hypothetical protein